MPRRIDREGPIQIAIVHYLRAVMPNGTIVHHAKNEINKRGAAIQIELAKAKRKGAVTGFPDLIVIMPAGRVVFFEVKAEGNYASAPQKEVHAALAELGHMVAVVRSIEDVAEALEAWGIETKQGGTS